MDAETQELNDISDQYNEIIIGGKPVKLNYPMKAWKKIKLEYGGIEGIQKSLTDDPISFFTDKLATLFALGRVDESSISVEEIQAAIDEKNIRELKDDFITAFMSALSGTLPIAKKKSGASGTPQKAE